MKKQKKGLHIGHFYITLGPLGVAALCLLVLALAAVVFFALRPDSDITDRVAAAPTVTATAAVIEPATPTPVVTPSPTPTPVPTPTPEPTPRSASIRFIGEISVDENVLSAALQPDGSYAFDDMLGMISGAVGSADYTIANVEGSMGGIGNGYSGKTDYNTPETLIGALKLIGVDMLTLSNDHALDAGFDGLLNTITNCQDYGMDYAGGAATREEHETPKIIDINGINVCFLNYTTTLNSREKATSSEAVEYGVNLAQNCNSRTDAAAARDAGADIIIAIISWGEDGKTSISDTQKKVAQILLDSDVDAIIGYGPRCTQAVLWLENPSEASGDETEGDEAAGDEAAKAARPTLCAISLGTFLSDSSEKGLDCGTIFEITISEQDDGSYIIENPVSIPTYVWKYSEDGKDCYRVLACGEWLEEQPGGMADEDYARMKEIWESMPDAVTEVSSISAN